MQQKILNNSNNKNSIDSSTSQQKSYINTKININDHQIKNKYCKKCRIKQNEIRNNIKILIIIFQNTNEMYCQQCLQQLCDIQQNQIKKIQQKYIYQKQFQSSMTTNDLKQYQLENDDSHVKQLQKQVRKLEQEQNNIDNQLQKVKIQCQQLQQKVYLLEQKEQKFWLDINKFQKRALKLQQKSFIAKNQIQKSKNSLQNLQKISIIHLFFKIQIQDTCGYVCGLIVGKKQQQLQVNWQSTNTALGHLLLAYNYLILKYGMNYCKIKDIKIKGHLSEILLKDAEMYLPVGFGINTGSAIAAQRTFGIVMQVLLYQMSNIIQYIHKISNAECLELLKLRFPIEKDGKIGDKNVNPTRLQDKSKWTQWSKAMSICLQLLHQMKYIYEE